MDETTIRVLNAINQRFYEIVAAEFDASRQQAWQGWDHLIEIIRAGPRPAPTSFRVLDVGCGNGRFGVFLADHLGRDRLRYTGIDSSAALLDRAWAALSGINAQFEQRDLVELPLDDSLGAFDLVALFGVLHHVPGADRRLALMRSLAERVASGGLLAFSEWCFLDQPSLRARVIAWDAGMQVEPGDYLLDWRRGTRAIRYCHAVDDAEHAHLIAAAGLSPLAEYRADAANLYTVMRR